MGSASPVRAFVKIPENFFPRQIFGSQELRGNGNVDFPGNRAVLKNGSRRRTQNAGIPVAQKFFAMKAISATGRITEGFAGEFKIDILVRIVESLNENFDAAVFPSVIAVLTNKGGVTIFRLGNLKADMQKGIVFEQMGDANGGVLCFFGLPKGSLF